MQLRLEVSNPEGAEYQDATSFDACIVDIDTLDAEWWYGVQVHGDLESLGVAPHSLRHHLHARGSGVEQDLGSFQNPRQLRRIVQGDGFYLDIEACTDELACLLALLGFTRRYRHVSAVVGQQSRRTLPYRAGTSQNHRLLAGEIAQRFLDLHDSRNRCRIGPVGVQHDRYAEGREQSVLRHGEELLAGGHIVAPDPDRGVVQVLGAAGEDASVNQVPDIAFSNSAIAHDDISAGVIGNDLIERARQARAVELEQELTHR